MDALQWIRDGLEKPGKTRSGLARALDRAPSAVTALLNGQRELKAREIPLIAAYLETEPPAGISPVPSSQAAWAGGFAGPSFGGFAEPNVRLDRAEAVPDVASRFGGPRDVPVRGTAVGGAEGDADFSFNGETIDYAPRPASIAHRREVYALFVENDSMYPRFKPGTRLYVDPKRTPHVDDDVVIEMKPTVEGEPGAGFIKTLVRRTPTKIVVKQFNPPRELEFDRDQVKELHRVIPWDELLGI
jgi:phage repressor protein C with HTH and peptisase S24 domain